MLNERICPICHSYMGLKVDLSGWLKCPSCSFCKKEEKSMVTADEILMGRAKFEELSDELKKNLEELLIAVNKLREAYGKPMVVSSGYRPAANNDKAGGSKKSSHMSLQAVDFRDNGDLFEFIKKDPKILESCGLYMEDPRWTKTWVHVQIRPTSKRIFLPYSDGRPATAPEREIKWPS